MSAFIRDSGKYEPNSQGANQEKLSNHQTNVEYELIIMRT